MKRWFILSAALALLTSAAVFAADEAAAPEGGKRDHPKFKGLMPPKALKELNLTKEQEAKYKALDQEFLKERQKWMEEHKPKDDAPAASGEDKDAKPRRPEGSRKEMLELRRKYMDQFRASLTPEQTKQLDGQIADMKERRESKHKKGDEPEGDK